MAASIAELLIIFRARLPEFVAMSDADVEPYLGDAQLIHCIVPQATVYLSAHEIATDNESKVGSTGATPDGGGPRETTNETAKGVSAGFSKTGKDGSSDTVYKSTAYGRKYLRLKGKRFTFRVG